MVARKRKAMALAITVAGILAFGVLVQWMPGWKSTAPEMVGSSENGSQEETTEIETELQRPPDPKLLNMDEDFNQTGHVKARQVELRFKQAVVMLHARRYEEAIAALHVVLRMAPRLVEAHVNMGYALLGLDSPKAAADFFITATELRPLQANAYYGLAEAYDKLGQLRMAIDAMETYVHLPEAEPKFKRKAQSAIWEWREALKNARVSEESTESNNLAAGELAVQPEGASTTTDEVHQK